MKLNILGSGNVATILGKKIKQAGHEVLTVYSPNYNHAEELSRMLQANPVTRLNELNSAADLFILAISDQALIEVASELRIGKKLVVHTAGSASINVLKPVSANIGVLYPLQSLRKELEVFPYLTMLIDGNTEESLTLVQDFANSFADKVVISRDDARLKLHTAAVIVNNFSNHLYTLAENYCRGEGVDFRLLIPLIMETASRLQVASPEQLQTGPAIRGDSATIEKHLELLRDYEELKEIYALFSEIIRQKAVK